MVCTESGCAKSLDFSYQDIFRRDKKGRKWTWMLSLSDRQSSGVMMSGWPGARTVVRDLPPNICEMRVLTELAYSYPFIHQRHRAQ